MLNLKQIVCENPLLAIMRNVPLEKTLSYAKAIFDGGVSFFEVALNSPHAIEQIEMLKEAFGESAYIGAGTAISVERAKSAINAGAQFLLSPSTDADVLNYCKTEGIAMLPGALTPSDVTTCMKYGFYTIKLFPANDMPKGYIKSLKGPLDGTEYIAIGGVNCDNATDFIRQGYLGVGMGSNILPKGAAEANDWQSATSYVSKILADIKNAKES